MPRQERTVTRRIPISCLVILLVNVGLPHDVFAQRGTAGPPPGVYKFGIEPHWIEGNSQFWYRNDLAGGKHEFVQVNAETGTRTVLAEPPAGATTAPTTVAQGRRGRGGNGLGGGAFNGPARGGRSPDGKYEAFVRDHNLFLRDTNSKEELALTTDGTDKDTYHRDASRARGVGMQFTATDAPANVGEVYWSPDSKHVIAMRTHSVPERSVYEVDSAPRDQVQPKLTSYPYYKPGDDIPVHKPHLFDVEARREVPVSDALFATPFDISETRWASDSSRFTFLYNQRGHQALRVIAVDAKNGDASALINEESKTFIDYSGKFFNQAMEDTGEIIWMSERDGWNHLYLYDSKSGQLKNQITKGQWVVRGVDLVDRAKRQIWFRASGIRPGQDNYFMHFARVDFDGTGLTLLTEGDGYHSIQFSPDRRFIIDTYSRVDNPPVHELRGAEDGRLICNLEKADASEYLATRHRFPEPFVAKGRDGQTDIYGVIWRPTDFDPSKKYAVIENIYAGPQDSFVPKNFRGRYPQQSLADRGFIVVQMDGMGTSNRSKAFHDVCWKNIGDAGFPDRILWIKAAAAKYPYMDLSRIGIYGTSAGGQNSLRGMLAHGDFYKVCVSDSGCHDNRMDKIWWNEQWMGYPVGSEYAEQSNVTQAHLLQGKLLLMWGELDRNVDPASTVQVINALVKSNKDFEMLMVPGAGHGVAGTPYGRKRLEEFFVKNLQ